MKLQLETTPGPSRILWFVFGAIAGTAMTMAVIVKTIFVLVAQGLIK